MDRQEFLKRLREAKGRNDQVLRHMGDARIKTEAMRQTGYAICVQNEIKLLELEYQAYQTPDTVKPPVGDLLDMTP
jgi:3-deoxy-D-manno-octulosonate 8-phosphate phosphatase KdsC-like HAD superfamily phosphatase